MLHHLRQQLEVHFPQQNAFLIGLSGGVDSVVLLTLFSQLRSTYELNLRAIHIHHGLSPNADHWATFCEKLCEEHQIPLAIKKVQVTGKEGVEGNARTARYQAIAQHLCPNEVFTTAHHLDDQAETFFLALKRGSGVKGLAAMQAVSSWQKMPLFRPLLNIPKEKILHYAQQSALHWIEDESNADNQFDRNFLRQRVLPLLNQRWQHFNQMVGRAAQHCAQQQQLLTELLEEELHRRSHLAYKRLDINGFCQFSLLKQQELIRLWLEKCGLKMPSTIQLNEILQRVINANNDKNPQITLGEHVLRRYQHYLFITPQFKAISPFQSPLAMGKTVILPDNIGKITRTETSLICEFLTQSYRLALPDDLQNACLIIKLQPSGKIKCYGKTQREEMKKIWQKNSVPIWERPRTPLLFIQEELVSVLHTFHNIEKQAIETNKTHG